MMTTIENRQLKGITIKNAVITIISTASIVASVVTSYFDLKSGIQAIKSSQETEARINNLRITVLENQVNVLQKQINQFVWGNHGVSANSPAANDTLQTTYLSAAGKR
ncbi:MAG TPA: hypothetical protein VHA56_19545 [Mucilaginibacter sp.]|nr:hypothetical protein [Mucilaginibacter sp.]